MKTVKMALAAAGCAMALTATPAAADVTWYVTGTFDDGGQLSGYFTVNVYGYLTSYDLLAGPGGLHGTDFDYTPATTYKSNTVSAPFRLNAWDRDPPYKGGLQLVFESAFLTPAARNDLVTNLAGENPSWECRDSWVCPTTAPGQNQTRFLESGRASTSRALVPEPATWALMILGFGTAGAALRRRRTAAA
jgi:hypothetical protein